ncbi:MAG: Large-conductance mechanosensitive channel [Mycoplasmataceae bacterium]|nr:MAG: Large-conductance mechanosensitive channel [Mycoplasmataceae bacterium]
MKRYFGLNNTEENLLVYGNLVNSVLNFSLVAPLAYFVWFVIKELDKAAFETSYSAHSKVWNGVIIAFCTAKILFWAFEAYCFAKATWNISKTENN